MKIIWMKLGCGSFWNLDPKAAFNDFKMKLCEYFLGRIFIKIAVTITDARMADKKIQAPKLKMSKNFSDDV